MESYSGCFTSFRPQSPCSFTAEPACTETEHPAECGRAGRLALGGEETARTEKRPGGRGMESDETGRETDGHQGQNPLDT